MRICYLAEAASVLIRKRVGYFAKKGYEVHLISLRKGEIEGVNLRFTDSALSAIADESLKRKSGARGLRAIMEKCMIDVMYEIPSLENVKECVIGEDTVINQEDPILLFEQPQKKAQDG